MLHLNAATPYYVDASKTDDSGDGLSWITAKQTINADQTLAVSGDNIFVKAGTYNFSASVSGTYALSTVANANYYGGFAGTESTPSQLVTSDLDGNGIVEPWEFSNLTIINFTLTNNAGGLNFTANTSSFKNFDGFTIGGSGVGGDLLGATMMTPIVNLNASSLFPNNNVAGLSVAANLNGANRNLLLNNVIRRNKITVDFTNTTTTNFPTGNNNVRGILISETFSSSTRCNSIRNNLIYNNEATYIATSGVSAYYKHCLMVL